MRSAALPEWRPLRGRHRPVVPAPIPSEARFRVRRLLRRLPGVGGLFRDPPASRTGSDDSLLGAAAAIRSLDGMLAEHYVALVCADLASLRPRFSALGMQEAVPLLAALPRAEACRALGLVGEVYGPVAFLPFPVPWLSSFVDVGALVRSLLGSAGAEVALTVLDDGFEGRLCDLSDLAGLVGGDVLPARVGDGCGSDQGAG